MSRFASGLAMFVVGTAVGAAALESGSPALLVGFALALAAGFVALGAHGVVFAGSFPWRAHDPAANLKAVLMAGAEPYSGLRAAFGVLALVGTLALFGTAWPTWATAPVLFLVWLVVGLPLAARPGPEDGQGDALGQPG